MVGVAEIVAAGHTQPALSSDVVAQGEGAGDERPENRGVEQRVDGEAGPDGAKGQRVTKYVLPTNPPSTDEAISWKVTVVTADVDVANRSSGEAETVFAHEGNVEPGRIFLVWFESIVTGLSDRPTLATDDLWDFRPFTRTQPEQQCGRLLL